MTLCRASEWRSIQRGLGIHPCLTCLDSYWRNGSYIEATSKPQLSWLINRRPRGDLALYSHQIWHDRLALGSDWRPSTCLSSALRTEFDQKHEPFLSSNSAFSHRPISSWPMSHSYRHAEIDDEAYDLDSAYGTDQESTHNHNPNNSRQSNRHAPTSQSRPALCIVRSIFPSTLMLLILFFRSVT